VGIERIRLAVVVVCAGFRERHQAAAVESAAAVRIGSGQSQYIDRAKRIQQSHALLNSDIGIGNHLDKGCCVAQARQTNAGAAGFRHDIVVGAGLGLDRQVIRGIEVAAGSQDCAAVEDHVHIAVQIIPCLQCSVTHQAQAGDRGLGGHIDVRRRQHTQGSAGSQRRVSNGNQHALHGVICGVLSVCTVEQSRAGPVHLCILTDIVSGGNRDIFPCSYRGSVAHIGADIRPCHSLNRRLGNYDRSQVQTLLHHRLYRRVAAGRHADAAHRHNVGSFSDIGHHRLCGSECSVFVHASHIGGNAGVICREERESEGRGAL